MKYEKIDRRRLEKIGRTIKKLENNFKKENENLIFCLCHDPLQ